MCPPGSRPNSRPRRKKEKIGFVPEKIVLESEKIEWRLKMIVCAITRSLS